uniref:LON peptidase N-terminal domain and ring finger 1 n=1 Tax=Gouania willdenowi TaxID=441366 RepID=A0A8C5DX56_GOUWI
MENPTLMILLLYQQDLVEKCFPEEARNQSHIQEKLRASDYMEALRLADEGLSSDDQSLKLYRAKANCGLRRFTDALTDLDILCCLRPNWTEGFFRKGDVLLEMGQQKDAIIQFQRCLQLQADFVPAKSQIKKVLEAQGVSVPEDVHCMFQAVCDYLKEPYPITTLSGSQGPGMQILTDMSITLFGTKVKHDTSTECCLSLCQAVSFLPAAEDEDDMMMRREDGNRQREQTLSVLTVSDFECPLCIRLFYEPVTTPCGHTFCKNCIERSLDHNLRCPLCKQPLQEYFKNRKYNPTVLLQDIVVELFPSQLSERKQVHDAEMAELNQSNLTKDIPIFVCTVAYPGVPCPLHIFEPRYRLMMRRCMDTGTKKFGMCSYEHGEGFAGYGCMLEIHGLELLPDGRSFVDAVGRDGYHTADIEYLEDLKVDGHDLEVLQSLHDSVYQQAQDWYQRLSSRVREQIIRQYGSMPDKEDDIQGQAWCWWLLSVFQLDPAYQTTVLSLTSLNERLGHLRLVLQYSSQS